MQFEICSGSSSSMVSSDTDTHNLLFQKWKKIYVLLLKLITATNTPGQFFFHWSSFKRQKFCRGHSQTPSSGFCLNYRFDSLTFGALHLNVNIVIDTIFVTENLKDPTQFEYVSKTYTNTIKDENKDMIDFSKLYLISHCRFSLTNQKFIA